MKATKNHDHFHSQAKEKTDVKSPRRKNLLLVNKNYFTLEHFCIKNINKSAASSLRANFAKKVDQRGLLFSHFLTQTLNTSFSDHVWIEQV